MSGSSATCQVTISGSFDLHWVDFLGEMLLYADVAEGHVRSTTLFGKPPDLAAFIGMLNLLADLGFRVIACEYHRANVKQPGTSSNASDAGSARGPTVYCEI
jgi:hypothetical protein